MRGFRRLGRMSDGLAALQPDPSDLLFFSPSPDGVDMRPGAIRARDFNMAACWAAVVGGVCEDDYVFVATALGEDCFK